MSSSLGGGGGIDGVQRVTRVERASIRGVERWAFLRQGVLHITHCLVTNRLLGVPRGGESIVLGAWHYVAWVLRVGDHRYGVVERGAVANKSGGVARPVGFAQRSGVSCGQRNPEQHSSER